MLRDPAGGPPRYIPYETWEERQGTRRNNAPRYYYLANALTEGEWRILSDLVQVYPYISQAQTDKFLRVLNRLRPGQPAAYPAVTPTSGAARISSASSTTWIGRSASIERSG